MKNVLFKGSAVFFMLIVVTSVMMDTFKMNFGMVDFFENHSFFFLLFITIVPRLTLLFSSVATGGLFWWLGFFFCPRILVASLATVAYFHTNPVLVTFSWLVALGGEFAEKRGLAGRKRFVFSTHFSGGSQSPFGHHPGFEQPQKPQTTIKSDDAIEAEFTKK